MEEIPFREHIRRQRVTKNIKQEYIAEQVGIKQPTYSRIESGDSDPPFSVMLGIAHALGCTIKLVPAPGSQL